MALQRRETRSGKVRWVARWRDKGGKEHSRSFDTKREAKQHLADVEVRAARGADTAPQRTTVRDVFDGWLATRDVREGTRAAYKDVRDRQLTPLLGYPVREVSAADVMEWTAQLREGRPWVSRDDEGLAESTVHTILVTVASCFKWAVQEGYIDRSPVRVPRKEVALDPVAIPTRAEIERVISTVIKGGAPYTARGLENKARPNVAVADMMMIALWAGLRVSEVAGLVVGDIDLGRGVIHVRAQLRKDSCERVVLKSRTSRRDVPIAPELRPRIEAWVVGRAPGDWLITSRAGGPVQVSHAAKIVRYAAEFAGAPGVHFHALRHYFVSSLLTAGVPVQDVARVAGHTPATTLATYTHVLDGYEARVGAALDSLSSGIGAGSGGLRVVD